jgi:hypothetical protein
MQVLGLISGAALILVGALVGVRLLLLARQTRQLPELSIGLGLLLMTVLGQPLAAVGRLPGWVATPLGDGLFGVGLSAVAAGIALIYVFTWRVFRPASPRSRAFVAVMALAVFGFTAGLLAASGRGDSLAEILPQTRPWACGLVATLSVAFFWTAAESHLYYRHLRRRLSLGLADPVVANRFLLWTVSGLATGLLSLLLIACLLAGMMVIHEPLPLFVIGVTGITTSVSWYLAFLPPEPYLRFVRGRTPAPA